MADEEKPLTDIEKFAARLANDDQALAGTQSLAVVLYEFFTNLISAGDELKREEAMFLTLEFMHCLLKGVRPNA